MRLDLQSLTVLVDRIADISEPLARTLCWSSVAPDHHPGRRERRVDPRPGRTRLHRGYAGHQNRTWQGFVYLATVIDCCTKECIGYAIADHMGAELVIDALRMAASVSARTKPSSRKAGQTSGPHTSHTERYHR